MSRRWKFNRRMVECGQCGHLRRSHYYGTRHCRHTSITLLQIGKLVTGLSGYEKASEGCDCLGFVA